MLPTTAATLRLTAAMFLWGGTWIAGRVVAQALTTPIAAASVRFLIAAVALAGVAQVRAGRVPRPPSGRAWLLTFVMGFFGIFLFSLCFFFGLQHIAAGRGALIVALNPVVIVLIAWLAGQERMSRRKAFGIALALAGCLMVIGNGDPLALLHGAVGLGEGLIMGCVAGWVIYTFIGREATRCFDPLGVTLYASLIGALLLGAVALALGTFDCTSWSGTVWICILYLAIGGTAIGNTWFADGVHHLGAGHAATFINLVPVFAVIQAAVLLDEQPGLPLLIGGALVIAGVWQATRPRKNA